MTHPSASTSQIEHVHKLAEIHVPDDSVVIVDASLPPSLIAWFRDAIAIEAGERLKTLDAVGRLAESVLQRRNTRPLTLVAVGGGTLGDAVGFLASILWRGVALWQIPTTLVAMVDSAHGGKTAVNLGEAKNQLGTFYCAQRVVLCDELLETLPVAQRRQGMVELIKALWLGAPQDLCWLDEYGTELLTSAPYTDVSAVHARLLRAAINVKLEIVARDPHETKGIRTVLNFGHTLAHALELHCELDHGSAVAWGLATACELSVHRAGLDRDQARRLYRHVYPLMTFIHAFEVPDDATMTQALLRDKKRVDGKLRSVLLTAPGAPVVQEVSPQDWLAAFHAVYRRWASRAVEVRPERERQFVPNVNASKSELNRALVIQHATTGRVRARGSSRAADVVLLARGLSRLGTPSVIDVGDGGTTFRFLLACAAMYPQTTFRLSPRLFSRPHSALYDTLRQAGCEIETDDREHIVRIKGWKTPPTRFTLDPSTSSQHVTAIALLAAFGLKFDLELTTPMVSQSYFELTSTMLERCNIAVSRHGKIISIDGSNIAQTDLRCAPDASSEAFWHVMSWCGGPIDLAANPSGQPDAKLPDVLTSFSQNLDLSQMPDAVPVVAAGAVVRQRSCTIDGGPTLRGKESNRLEDLRDLLVRNGAAVNVDADTLVVSPRSFHPSVVDPLNDHRLAFAGLLLARLGPLRLLNPWVVAKSYPEIFDDLRELGWSILPLDDEGA